MRGFFDVHRLKSLPKKLLAICVFAGTVICCVGMVDSAAQTSSSAASQFQSAVSFYGTRQFARAQEILTGLLRQFPDDFKVNELMALVLEAQHDYNPAGDEFKKAAELAPQSYEANHNLGEFYLHRGKITAAIPCLEKAQEIKVSYDNGYDLALAEIETGKYVKAEQEVRRLLAMNNTAELHSLLAAADEESGQYVQAADEYELAAHTDPSEENLFDWGSELLRHDALQPATEVFQRGVEMHPSSPRLRIGLV